MLELRGLRRIRQAQLMSQADLAAKSGVAEPTISRIELGKERARYVTARKLAEALGVQPNELLRDSEGG